LAIVRGVGVTKVGAACRAAPSSRHLRLRPAKVPPGRRDLPTIVMLVRLLRSAHVCDFVARWATQSSVLKRLAKLPRAHVELIMSAAIISIGPRRQVGFVSFTGRSEAPRTQRSCGKPLQHYGMEHLFTQKVPRSAEYSFGFLGGSPLAGRGPEPEPCPAAGHCPTASVAPRRVPNTKPEAQARNSSKPRKSLACAFRCFAPWD
jgi:hypothetical protein